MKSKFFNFFLCSVILSTVSFTGCGNELDNTSDKTKSNTKEETEQSNHIEDVSKNLIQLNTTLHFNGNDITIPCQFSELGNVELDTSRLISGDDNDVYGAIYKGDNRIGRVMLKDLDINDENVGDNVVTYFELNPDMGFEGVDFTYQGFTYETSKEQIIDAFGTPDEEYNNNVCYYLKNDGYVEFEFIKEFSEIESIKIKLES